MCVCVLVQGGGSSRRALIATPFAPSTLGIQPSSICIPLPIPQRPPRTSSTVLCPCHTNSTKPSIRLQCLAGCPTTTTPYAHDTTRHHHTAHPSTRTSSTALLPRCSSSSHCVRLQCLQAWCGLQLAHEVLTLGCDLGKHIGLEAAAAACKRICVYGEQILPYMDIHMNNI